MKISVPKGACDTHMHIYDTRVPALPGTPMPGDFPVEAYRAVQQRLGLERVVVVQPNAYGYENAVTLAAEGYEQEEIAEILGPDVSARAVEGLLRRHRSRVAPRDEKGGEPQ